ncbi:MAG: SEC-C domain-containing protein [Rhodocyclaceae bacterium]|nr:SEC-C domain-containing protein [Rhodocyclaceae bacterium]
MTDARSEESPHDLDTLLRIAVQESLAQPDFTLAFASYLDEIREQCARFLERLPEDTERPLAFAIFREVWQRTARPDDGWQRSSPPRLERNAPCPCGSGARTRDCCGGDGPVPFPAEGLSVLGYVLETVPVSRYAAIPFGQLDPEEVAHVANQWQEEGRVEVATLLLEGLLAPGQHLGRHHEWAFDTLCNFYMDAGREADRQALVERLLDTPDTHLQGAAWQRQATVLADRGDRKSAWKAFEKAMRLAPDNPALAHLEIVMLANENRLDEVQERAAFWAHKLRRAGLEGEAITDLMDAVAEDPAALDRLMDASDGAFEEAFDDGYEVEIAPGAVAALQALIDELPAPASQYRLKPSGDALGPLEPKPALKAVEAEWATVAWDDPDEIWEDTEWLSWLADTPLAWQSFDILEAVLEAITELQALDLEDDAPYDLEDVLLTHAVAVLRRVLTGKQEFGRLLEWGWHQNRPALRLLMAHIDAVSGTADELPLLRWLVLTLNPNDNTGHRERLVHACCAAGQAAEALDVCDRYPGDCLPGILYGRVLALFLLGRHDDARDALAAAAKHLPKVLRTLLAKRPRQPDLTPGVIRHGGADQAWVYRAEYLPVWTDCDAIDWLRQAASERR